MNGVISRCLPASIHHHFTPTCSNLTISLPYGVTFPMPITTNDVEFPPPMANQEVKWLPGDVDFSVWSIRYIVGWNLEISSNVERTSVDDLFKRTNRNWSWKVLHTFSLLHSSRQRNIFYSRKGSLLSGNPPELWFTGKFCRLSSNIRRLGRLSGLIRFNPIILRTYKGCQG